MPIYEYACDSCHTRFEIQQKMSDPPVATCSKCGNAVKKLISPPAIMFKGTGWYVTDYSDKMKPPASGEGSEAKPKTEAKTPASETKSAPAGTGNGTTNASPSSSTTGPSGGTTSGSSNTSSTPSSAGSSGSSEST